MNRRYITWNNMPPKINVLAPLTWLLVFERFNVPEWTYGVIVALTMLVWSVELVRICTWNSLDVCEND